MRSVVHFTTVLPSKLWDNLSAAGFRVFEAIEISEVMYLCEHERIDALLIGPDIEEPEVVEVQLRCVAIKLKAESTAKDVLWELSNLFPDAKHQVQ